MIHLLKLKPRDLASAPRWLPWVVLVPLAGIVAFWVFDGYLVADASFYCGLGLLPLVTLPRATQRHSALIWITLALAASVAGYFLPARTLHFFAVCFVFYAFWVQWKGAIAPYPIFVIVLMSALVQNWVSVFSFPIRLQLSDWAAKVLQIVGQDASSAGNMIILNQQSYSVDAACMGLYMVQVSLLFAVALTALYERHTHTKIASGYLLFIILPSVVVLNIGYNLLRILLLVIMNWMPGNPMHDAAGLVGLAIYVLLPTYFLVRWLYRRKGVPLPDVAPINSDNVLIISPLYWLLHGLLLLSVAHILWFGTARTLQPASSAFTELRLALPTEANYQKQYLEHGVVKYSNDKILIYIKPIRAFFSSEHTPLICWKGSGYDFGATSEATLPNGNKIFKALLNHKDGSTLHTAWWYSNGQVNTNSQWTWRWLDMTGAPGFHLVNVTAATEGELMAWIKHTGT